MQPVPQLPAYCCCYLTCCNLLVEAYHACVCNPVSVCIMVVQGGGQSQPKGVVIAGSQIRPAEELFTALRKVWCLGSYFCQVTQFRTLPVALLVTQWRGSLIICCSSTGCALQGSTLQKYGRRGGPKWHHFRLSGDDSNLQWKSANV
jgi:hypothetical protein